MHTEHCLILNIVQDAIKYSTYGFGLYWEWAYRNVGLTIYMATIVDAILSE